MTARTIVITGASDGIGAAAAKVFSERGDTVVLVGRDPVKTERVARALDAPFHVADYGDLQQVRQLAKELYDYANIDVLANNAGGIIGERRVTVDGFEQTFQVNHLAGFLLTELLMPKLVSSQATVIQTSSVASRTFADFRIDDLQNERDYTPHKAYGNAKLANILFTRELQRRHGSEGVSAVAFHPGVVGTNFANEQGTFLRALYHTPVVKNLFTISPEKGAEPLVWLADGTPDVDWEPGGYYERKKPGKLAPAARDEALAARLWDESAAMVGLEE